MQPGGALIVKVSEGTLFQRTGRRAVGVEPAVARLDEVADRFGDGIYRRLPTRKSEQMFTRIDIQPDVGYTVKSHGRPAPTTHRGNYEFPLLVQSPEIS